MKPNLQNSISNWSYHYSVYIALLRVYILQPQSLILPIFILTQGGWDFLSCMIWNEVKISKFEFFGHCTQGTTLPIAHNKVRSKVNTKLVREVYTTYLMFSSTYCRFPFYYFHWWTYLCWIFWCWRPIQYSFTSLKAVLHQD